MTAANLTIRAERALLGAMIASPHLASELTAEPADFADPVHSRIFDAITRADMTAELPSATRLSEIVAALGQPQIHQQTLDMLVRWCPEPGHGHVYAHMVQEAGIRRVLAAHADRIGQQAASLGYDARRLIRVAGESGFGAEHLSLHEAKVATALRAQIAAFDPDTAPVITGPARPTDLPGSPHLRAAPSPPWGTAVTGLAGWYAREQAEEQLLSALLQNHPGSESVLAMLSAAEFTDPGRRLIYTTLRDMIRRGQSADPLIIDWDIARHRPAPLEQGGAEASSDSYAARLSCAPADPGKPLDPVVNAMLTGGSGRQNITLRTPTASRPGHPPILSAPVTGPPPDRDAGPRDLGPRL